MSHDTPNIVADNHVAQVMSASLEYFELAGHLAQRIWQDSKEWAPYFVQSIQPAQGTDHSLSKQSFLDFVTGHTY